MTASITCGRITFEGDNAEPVISRPCVVHWDAEEPSPAVHLAVEEAAQLTAFAAALPTGAVDLVMMQTAALSLRSMLGAERFAGDDCGTELLELFSPLPLKVLTDIPWEAAARTREPLASTQGALFEQLLASLPICRLICGAPVKVEADGSRPRLLLLISNPPDIDGGALRVTQVENACRQVLKEYPVFQVQVLGPALTWAAAAPAIVRFEPTVLVVVGHGWSNPQAGGPTLAFVRENDPFASDRISVSELAQCLARVRSCRVVALIACDMVRASEKSGAVELVQHGVSEVVAMQGSIDQSVARPFLARLLGELLAGQTVPIAAAAARRVVRSHAHAIFPTVFRAAGLPRDPGSFAELSASYTRALATLDARVREFEILARPTLENTLSAILHNTGVALVSGGFGQGTSTLLRKAISEMLRKRCNRPILYLDHDQRLGGESLIEWIARECSQATCDHPILQPKSAPTLDIRTPGVGEVSAWAVESEITLVIDNLSHPLAEDEQGVLEAFSSPYRGLDARGLLLLAGRGPLSILDDLALSLEVPAFSEAEVGEYARKFLPEADVGALYELTGGTPLLLDLERRTRTRAHRRAPPHGAATVDEYLMRLLGFLSVPAQIAAARLAQFDAPLDQALVQEFVTPDLEAALVELSTAGLTLVFESQGRPWIQVPRRKRGGFLTDAAPAARTTLAHIFIARYESDPDHTVRHISAFGGAASFLRVLQSALTEVDRSDISIDLAIQSQDTPVPASDLLILFETAIELLGSERGEVPDVLIGAARTALALGQTYRAEEWLQELPTELSPQHEIEALALRISVVKDRYQEHGLAESLKCWTRILALLAQPSGETDADWERVRAGAILDMLPTQLFLIGEPADPMEATLVPLMTSLSATERALLWSTLAEREMREPPEHLRWNRVAEWVTDATTSLGDGDDARVRTYVLYQYAQYLAKRPEPLVHEAWELYEQARAAGELAGETRRRGLALLRLAQLESDHPELRHDEATWLVSRLRELDVVSRKLTDTTADALTLRTLGRLQQWGALHDPDVELRRSRFLQSARALAARALSSPADKRRLAEVCVQALESELGPGGRFLAAQRFLGSLRFDIARKLGVTVPMDNPAAACEALRGTLG